MAEAELNISISVQIYELFELNNLLVWVIETKKIDVWTPLKSKQS